MHPIAVSLIAYTAAATVLTTTPGLDTALVVRTATTEGARRALWSGIGIVTGCFIWTAMVAAGLGVLLLASQLAYTVLRWIGAATCFTLASSYSGVRAPALQTSQWARSPAEVPLPVVL